jgi:hypothetical protein
MDSSHGIFTNIQLTSAQNMEGKSDISSEIRSQTQVDRQPAATVAFSNPFSDDNLFVSMDAV